ncbi:MAG: lytic transglycosylase domain-containing protein [Deltaproteobacteria bacterium]|nr:lytic transglycosylase domain-containing protein [Deltaproteobacteria bacterium]
MAVAVRHNVGPRVESAPRLVRYPYSPALRFCNAGMPRSAFTATPAWRRDPSTSFILVASITVIFTVIILVGSLRQSMLPRVTGFEEDEISFSISAPTSKDGFLSRMNTQQRRQLIGQVHYVSELIRNTVPNHREANNLAYAIVAEALNARVDPLFVAAVIKSESTFNKVARSYAGALGLMQLMPDTARYVSKMNSFGWTGTEQLKDPVYNIKLGVAYLKYLSAMYDGNKELMLIAYNWGPANLSEALKNGFSIPGSTKKYASTIIGNHARWKQEYAQRMPEFQYLSLDNVG